MDAKTFLIVGPTGAGKSRQISRYCQGAKPVIGHNLNSETTETKGYDTNIAGENIKIYDTPGLGDSEQRDQIFLDELVRVLQDRCAEIKEKPSILTLMLTRADRGGESYWGPNLENKLAQFREVLRERVGSPINIILVGEGNQEQFVNDVRNTSIHVFAQTKFMKNVETLAKQKAMAEEALAKARQDNEQNQEKIAALQNAVSKAEENYEKQCQTTRQQLADLSKQFAEAQRAASRRGGGGGLFGRICRAVSKIF